MGASVMIYRDVAVRMVPLSGKAAMEALRALRGGALLRGYRGRGAVCTSSAFIEGVYRPGGLRQSIALNPVFCGGGSAVIAGARILLKK